MKQITKPAIEAKTWLEKHERLVIVILVLSACIYLGSKWISHSAAVADAKNNAAQQVLVQQQEANKQLLTQMQVADANYEASLAASNQKYADLVKSMYEREATLIQQQQKDQVMSPSDLTKRWAGLVDVSTSDIQTNSIDYTVTDNVARKTVSALEQVPVLEQDKKDLQSVVTSDKATLNACQIDLDKTKGAVVGLQSEIKDTNTACATQVDAIKKNDRKSKLKWFGIGFGAGYVAGVASTIAIAAHL